MSLHMLLQVANLAEGRLTVRISTNMRLLIGVSHQVIIELSNSMNNSITFRATEAVLVLTFKYLVLLLEVMALLDVVKGKLRTFRNNFVIAELASIKVCSIKNGHLVIVLYVLLPHKFFREELLAWVEVQREKTFVI